MKNDILLYPSLNEEIQNRIRFQNHKYSFYYTDSNDDEFDLTSEPIEAMSSIYCLKDTSGRWTQDDNNLCFRRQYCLRTFQCLFGENGIACTDAELGIGIMWTSSESKQRGMIKAGIFTSQDQIVEFEVDHQFGKAQLRGNVDFETIIYLSKPGMPNENETHLINQSGYILGALDSFALRLDGNSSSFPIFEASEPGKPLWYVKCDWQDPTVDLFSDCVSININTAHKNYKYIDREQKCYDPQLLAEIMSSALSVIIEKLRVEGELTEILNNDSLEMGSVGQAVYYFMDALEWDLSSPEKVSISARKFFDQRM